MKKVVKYLALRTARAIFALAFGFVMGLTCCVCGSSPEMAATVAMNGMILGLIYG